MAMVKGKNTIPECRVRRLLYSKGIRYRINDSRLPGKPDIAIQRYKTVIFVNGCFWHGHEGCKYYKIPQTRSEWWKNKIEKTKLRDKQNITDLKQLEWKVVVIWECEIKGCLINEVVANLVNSLIIE